MPVSVIQPCPARPATPAHPEVPVVPLCDQKLSKSNAWPADPTLVVDRPQVTAVRSGDAVGDASRYSTVLEVPA